MYYFIEMFTLPNLPYTSDFLEPYIDSQTMEIHHEKHHGTYVKNLNDLLNDYPDLLNMDVGELIKNLDNVPDDIRTKVRNNAGGHSNHSFFWDLLNKEGGEPGGDLLEQINSDFGSLENLKKEFNTAGLSVLGSGWVWIVYKENKLQIITTPNQDSPLMDNKGIPVLAVDVWEHAYYLKYQNKRVEYLENIWNIMDFQKMADNFEQAKNSPS